MNYLLKGIPVGPVAANCYILACAKTKEAVIIDPGAQDNTIKQQIRRFGFTPKFIINTHGHVDHIGANSKMGLPVYIHKADAEWLTDPVKNISALMGMPVTSPAAKKFIEDGDKLAVGELILEIIHTPGHTPGSICIKCEDFILTGDTLFAEGVGRTDLAGGSESALMNSIKEKLLILPDQTKVYPGHGPDTTIGREKVNNPFLS